MNRLEEFLKRNRKRNKHLWMDDVVENIDYIVCPVTGTRLSMLKRNYIEKTLNMSYNDFITTYPHQKMVCDKRLENIKTGLQEIDVSTGLTKHQTSMVKAKQTLEKIDEFGVSGYKKKGQHTKNGHLSNIDENGLNGYQRLAKYRNETVLDNGLTIQENALLKTLQKRGIDGRQKMFDRYYYNNLVRYLSTKSVETKQTDKHNDHIFPVSRGYEHYISPFVMSHPNNLMLVDKDYNVSKGSQLHITPTELFEMVGVTKEQNNKEFSVFMLSLQKQSKDFSLALYSAMVKELGYGFCGK